MRPIVFGEFSIHDDDGLVVGVVGLIEITSANQRNADGFEVIADELRRYSGSHQAGVARIDIAVHDKCIWVADAIDGEGVRQTHGLNARQLLELLELMAPDVVLVADGGGVVAAARAPIHGIDLVAPFLARANQVVAGFTARPIWLNGAPAGRIESGGEPSALSLVVENGQVTRIYVVRNPRKLTRLDEPSGLAR